MKRLYPILLFLALAFSASAQIATQRISMTIVVTNRAVTSNTLVVNASTRTWTNASTSTTIATNLVSTATTATNLYNNIASFPYSGGIFPQWLSETSIVLRAPLGAALSGSQSGNWAIITLSTQANPLTFTALWPIENIVTASNRTNEASSLVGGMSQFSTNAFATNSTAGSNFVTKGASPQQNIASSLLVGGTLRVAGGVALTNGYTSATTNINMVSSNGINYGNAFRSEGAGVDSLQLGRTATASGLRAVAVGVGAIATNTDAVAVGTAAIVSTNAAAFGNAADARGINATALGTSANAGGQGSTAIGHLANAGGFSAFALGELAAASGTYAIAIGNEDTLSAGTNAIAIGKGTVVNGQYSIVLGANGIANQNFSTAIGGPDSSFASVQIDTTNQLKLGTVLQKVSIPGALEAGNVRSLHAVGTNQIDGIFAFTNELTVTTVALGHNVIDSSTNTVLYLTGSPGGAWTLGGFSGDKTVGRELEVWNLTGFDVTIQNESGTAPTASDRIVTYATAGGTNVTLTANGVMKFRRAPTSINRWQLTSPQGDITASGTNGVNSISTNGVSVSSAATALNFVGNNNASVEQATNTAGQVAVQFAPLLFRCTNYGTIYNYGDWEPLINEEFYGQVTSTVGRNGTHDWTAGSAGTLPAFTVIPMVESNAWSYITCTTTQTTSGRFFYTASAGSGVPVGTVLTNAAYYMEWRVRMSVTNVTSDVCTARFGLSDIAAANGEANNGVYIMNNTNVNTNTYIAVTARGGARTFNYSTIATFGNYTWTTLGIYLDNTGTNAVFMYGPDRYRFTSFATNTANMPGDSAQVGAFWQVDRMASPSGLAFRSNYVDRVKFWVRPYL